MNYRELIDLAIADLDEFFDNSHSSQITAESTLRRLMGATGINENRKILIEKFIATTPVQSLEDVLKCLILAGHEMCHLMNNHNQREDWRPSERRALEMWADFFGARITFTLITHGQRIRHVIAINQGPLASPTSLPPALAQDRLLGACGRVFDDIYNIFSCAPPSEKYPTPSERLHSMLAGVNSFFGREFGKLHENWTLFVFRKLAFERDWFLRSANDISVREIEGSQFELISSVHQSIAGGASISPGLLPRYENLIGTGYKNTLEGRRLAAQAMAQEFSKWEIDIGADMAEFLNARGGE